MYISLFLSRILLPGVITSVVPSISLQATASLNAAVNQTGLGKLFSTHFNTSGTASIIPATPGHPAPGIFLFKGSSRGFNPIPNNEEFKLIHRNRYPCAMELKTFLLVAWKADRLFALVHIGVFFNKEVGHEY